MKAELSIFEKLDNGNPPKIRKRKISLETESLTLGTDESADIVLCKFSDAPLMLEIKQDKESWWVVNLRKSGDVGINGHPFISSQRLQHRDELTSKAHRILFEISDELSSVQEPRFDFVAKDDEDLWTHLLSEKEFDEVLINGAHQIYVDFKGVLFSTPWKFSNHDFLVAKVRTHSLAKSDTPQGWHSWRLDRSLRIHAALSPVVEVPHLSIRKAKSNVLSLEKLEANGFGTPDEMSFLKQCVLARQNIVISGGTSTGKTVLLRSLVEKIPTDERVIVVEEESETNWPHPHLVAIESGRGLLRSTVIECLRMRPNRLIVSEVRGAETFEMLQAMNTGHDGSMTTLHSNSAREALARLENLVLSAGISSNISAIRRQIAQAIHVIVQLGRSTHGTRKIEQIARVGGIQKDVILLSEPIGLEPIGIKQNIN